MKATCRCKTGEVVAIFCFYHKQWEMLEEFEYGTNVANKTGYRNMCKVGQKMWARRNRANKKRKVKDWTIVPYMPEKALDEDMLQSLYDKAVEDDGYCELRKEMGL